MKPSPQRKIAVLEWKHLAACIAVTFVMGSVHAFSVFLVPLENQFAESRAAISLVYSTALIMITLAVLFGHHIYSRYSSSRLVLVAGLLASAGLVLASTASSWLVFLLGYGVLFGLANGFAYGYSLQLSGQLMPHKRGFAMGTVTAGYALGSVIFALILSRLVSLYSVQASLFGLAALLVLSCVVSAVHFFNTGSRFQTATEDSGRDSPAFTELHEVLLLAAAYFCAVFAGLMAIGHAAAIADPSGVAGYSATGAIVVGAGSSIGGVVAGWLIDHYASRALLVGLALISASSLLLAASNVSSVTVIASLCLIGFAYGAIIAVYPVVIARRFGADGPRIYGRVFISWGVAGLSAPWFAGWIFDGFDNYRIALLLAAVVAVGSAWIAGRLELSDI